MRIIMEPPYNITTNITGCMTYCEPISRLTSRWCLGCRSVATEAMEVRMALFRLGGDDPELCIAAGRSPLSTCTITDADSVTKIQNLCS